MIDFEALKKKYALKQATLLAVYSQKAKGKLCTCKVIASDGKYLILIESKGVLISSLRCDMARVKDYLTVNKCKFICGADVLIDGG